MYMGDREGGRKANKIAEQEARGNKGFDMNSPTVFKGKIGIVLNIVEDTGNDWVLKSVMDIPGKYFDDLDARNVKGSKWYEMNDFMEVSVPDGYFVEGHGSGVPGYRNARIINDPYVKRIMKEYALEQVYNMDNRRTFKTRDVAPIVKSPYYEFDDMGDFNDFYIYPNSPADKWISGNQNEPYDHRAPAEFGVSYTLVRRKLDLLRGGNPKIQVAGMIFDEEDKPIEALQAFYMTDLVDFNADLLVEDFDYTSIDGYSPGLPNNPDGSNQKFLYYYKGERRADLENFVINDIQRKVGKEYLIDLAGADAELYVLPNSELEEWIRNGRQSNNVLVPSPMTLQVRLQAIKRDPAEVEEEVDARGDVVPDPQYQFEEEGYDGKGSAPRDVPRDADYLDNLEALIDQMASENEKNLDKQQLPYKVKDMDMDGDYDEQDQLYEADDLFGTRQGDEKDMTRKTAFDFQEGAPVDYYRPFDEYDNQYHKVERQIDSSKIITKRELMEFNAYAEEAYMSEREFDMKTRGIQYLDNRKESFLVAVGNAEARVYEYYDSKLDERRLIIAFRGTTPPSMKKPFSDTIEFVRDVMTDLSTKVQNLEYIGITNPDPSTKGIVHQGFADYCNALYDQLTAIIKYTVRERPKAKIYLCGHSLGAISCVVYGYMLLQREGIHTTRIYQFGAPMGIWTFGDAISKTLPIINVFHTHDIITPVSALFKHHGTKLVFDLDGNLTAYPVGMEVPNYDNMKYAGERLLLALRKNGAYRDGTTLEEQITSLKEPGAPDPLRDDEYDKIINQYSFTNFLDNLGALYTNYKQPAQREALAHIGTILREAGFNFYHTRYRQTIDEWKDKSIQIDKFRYFANLFKHDPNPRSFHNKHGFNYHSSLGNQPIYTDINGNFFFGSNSVGSMNFHPIGNTQPLGLIFYDKNMNINDKAIVFYS